SPNDCLYDCPEVLHLRCERLDPAFARLVRRQWRLGSLGRVRSSAALAGKLAPQSGILSLESGKLCLDLGVTNAFRGRGLCLQPSDIATLALGISVVHGVVLRRANLLISHQPVLAR